MSKEIIKFITVLDYEIGKVFQYEISRQGWNPDVSGWEQFWNAVTLGMVGRSGAEQLQEEVEAFSGIDGLFDAEEDKLMTEADRLGIERGGGKWSGPSKTLQDAIDKMKAEEDAAAVGGDSGYDAGSDFSEGTTAAEQESEMSEMGYGL